MNNNNGKYDDIITLPHHVSKKHPKMSQGMRAAQFAPFAALTGYDEVISETSRLTDERKSIGEEVKAILDVKLQIITEKMFMKPIVTFTYFVADSRKSGGRYEVVTGIIKKIDEYRQLIVLEDKTEIPILDVVEITGDIFNEDEIL